MGLPPRAWINKIEYDKPQPLHKSCKKDRWNCWESQANQNIRKLLAAVIYWRVFQWHFNDQQITLKSVIKTYIKPKILVWHSEYFNNENAFFKHLLAIETENNIQYDSTYKEKKIVTQAHRQKEKN